MDPHNSKRDDNVQDDLEHVSQSSRTASVRYGSKENVGQDSFHEKRDEAPVNIHDKLRNPLAGISKAQLMADVEAFANEKNLTDSLPELQKGALVAQNPKGFESISELTEEDKEVLRMETTHRWHQPRTLYYMTSKNVEYEKSLQY